MALKSSPKWCDLPPELVDVVGKLLGGPTDTWHMRSVCSSWRSAVPARGPGLGLAVQFPINDPIKFFLQNSSSSNDSENQNQSYLRLAKHTFFHLMPASSSAGWLIKIEEKPGGLGTTTFHLFNPFSRTRSPTHPAFNFKLDLTKLKIQELASEYVLHNHNMEHEKVAFLNLTIANHRHHHEYAILSTHNTGKLLLYRSTLNEWSFLDDFILGYDDRSIFVNDWSLHYVDVVEYQGSFYAVTNSGRTVAIKLDSSSVSITLVTKSIIGGDRKCLVKSADDLLMVDLYTCPTPGASLVKVNAAEIFKLDKQQQTWVLIKTLGHRSLFLSNHSCFSVSPLPGCKPNSIFFHFKNFDYYKDDTNITDIDHHPALFSWNRDEIGVFDFEKGILGSLPDYLLDSQLFSWPPPAWVTAST